MSTDRTPGQSNSAAAETDPQVARLVRRERLTHLLDRMRRGTLLPAERDLLRAAVETAAADGDQAHAEAASLREGIAYLRQEGVRLTRSLADARYESEGETKRADRAEATIERMKRTTRMVNMGAREERERAEKAERALAEATCCTHCGEPIGVGSVVTTPGGTFRADYIWHAGRAECVAAAQAHRVHVNKLGRIVPPVPESGDGPWDACSSPPCLDSEICTKHALAADLAEERAAHEEHRRGMVEALSPATALGDAPAAADWPSIIRVAGQVTAGHRGWREKAMEFDADRDRLAADLAAARATDAPWLLAEREDRRAAEQAAENFRGRATAMERRAKATEGDLAETRGRLAAARSRASQAERQLATALRDAADAYERDQSDAYPGPVYGVFRRVRARQVGAWLRARADEISWGQA